MGLLREQETKYLQEALEEMRTRTPRLLNYRLPAEWEPHVATWIAWPKNIDTFPEKILPKVEETYCNIVEALRKDERVKIMVDNEDWDSIVENILNMHGVETKGVEFYHIKTRDVWVRDYGPTFIISPEKKLGGVKWIFNAWGGKYPDLAEDNNAGIKLLLLSGAEVFRSDTVFEGGAIETDGGGLAIITEESMLNDNRNPGLTREKAESILRDYLGIKEFLWLERGLIGDDTDGHIDVFCRFVTNNKLLLVWDGRHNVPNKEIMSENKEKIEAWIKKSNREIDLYFLPLPLGVEVLGVKVPATYANFYISNRHILVPVFDVREDEEAINIIQDLVSDKEIIPINCRELFYGLGGIHCVTLQEPMHK
ncbi:MAG: agmatine deiminase family protein [Nitrososphaerota archaeon]